MNVRMADSAVLNFNEHVMRTGLATLEVEVCQLVAGLPDRKAMSAERVCRFHERIMRPTLPTESHRRMIVLAV
jgi:hypothetical protein